MVEKILKLKMLAKWLGTKLKRSNVLLPLKLSRCQSVVWFAEETRKVIFCEKKMLTSVKLAKR